MILRLTLYFCAVPFVPIFILLCFFFFFFNDTATTEIYTLSLHDALPISRRSARERCTCSVMRMAVSSAMSPASPGTTGARSEEHTSELQSQSNLVCRLLLEKKKKKRTRNTMR